MNEPRSQSLNTAWERHRLWSAGADREKRSLTRWRLRTLVLGSTGAVLEAGAAQTRTLGLLEGVSMGLALSGALALAVVTVIIPWKLGKDGERRWIRSRSISENLKSEAYKFLARAGPLGLPRSRGRVSAFGHLVMYIPGRSPVGAVGNVRSTFSKGLVDAVLASTGPGVPGMLDSSEVQVLCPSLVETKG